VFANGKPALRVRYDGELRHVTAFLPDGRTIERTFTRRELAAAARPALDVSGSDGSTTPVARDNADCLKEWVAYAGASLVAVVTCAETGPTPLCAAALATAANALEAAIKCETAKS
jgi:hypothetical protein